MSKKAIWITIVIVVIIIIALVLIKNQKDKADAAALLKGETITKGGRMYSLKNGVVVPVQSSVYGCLNGIRYIQNGGTWSPLGSQSCKETDSQL